MRPRRPGRAASFSEVRRSSAPRDTRARMHGGVHSCPPVMDGPQPSMVSHDDAPCPRRRLRVPAVLAVAIVGTSASVAIGIAGCDTGMPEPIDALSSGTVRIDAATDAVVDSLDDAELPADAPDDAPADTPVV